MVIVSFWDAFKKEMLNILLYDRQAFCLPRKKHLSSSFMSCLVWPTHVVRTFKIAHLLRRQIFFFFKTPHSIQHFVNLECYGFVFKPCHIGTTGFKKITYQFKVMTNEVFQALTQTFKGQLRLTYSKFCQFTYKAYITHFSFDFNYIILFLHLIKFHFKHFDQIKSNFRKILIHSCSKSSVKWD